VKKPLPHQELRTVQIARQTSLPVPALVSIDLGPTKCCAFAALSADTKVDMGAREDHLVWTGRWIAADQNTHRLCAGPTGTVLLGNTCTPLHREAGVQQIGQNLPLAPVETQENRMASAPDSTIMVLPQRMIVADACLATLSIVKAGVKTPREDIDGFNL